MKNPFLKTKNRPLEGVAEWSIRIVASFCIIVIFLIFLFVFKETLGLFLEDDSPTVTITEQSDYGIDESGIYVPRNPDYPEIYNPEVGGLPDDIDLVGGRNIYVPKNPDYPEIYNPEVGGLPDDIDLVDGLQLGADTEAEDEGFFSWANISGSVWQPIGEEPKYGITPLLIGTAKTTFIAILFGAPLGILAALYTAFFAPRRLREIVKPAIELLAGFPSVVIGFFCLVTVATFIQDTFDTEFRLNALVGGIGLSLAVLPIVYSIAEDALSAVPKSLREASLALGSTEWQTAYRVMLPAAAPGVIAAVILGIGRAFGETMIAIMATGNGPMMSWSGFTPARTFAATVGSEMGEVVWGSEHYGILFLLGTILFMGSFGLNAITELFVKKRLIKRFQGK